MIRIYLHVLLLICLGLVGEATVPAYGQAATTVALSPLPTGTVAAGTVVILIASVSDTSGPVLGGNVAFFDGTKTIGTVSVVRNANANYVPGTATLRRIFGPGGHNIRAVYDGTLSEQTSSSSTNTLTVASGAATPSSGLVYGTTRSFNPLTRLEGFVLTDINNDGVLDLVAPQFGMSNIAISLGDATRPGSFLPPTFVSTSTSTVDSVAVGDLTGDGLPDIVFGDADNTDAGVLLQDPAHPGTFLSAKFVGATQSKPLIADMNHDGIPDLILVPGGQSAAVVVLLGDSHNPGSFLAPTTTSLGGSDIRSVATADMNGDGLPDVVIGNYTAQTVSVLLNDSAHPGNLLPKVDYPAGGSIFDLAIGDLNGDGKPDVVLGTLFSGVTILLGSTANPGQLLTPHSYPVTATPAGGRSLGVAIGDIDGDGIPDVVSGNYGPSFDLLLGNGDGTLRAATAYATGPTPDTFEAGSMAVGDVDGDGLTDVVVGQFYQNSVQIFLHQRAVPSLAITATDMSLRATVVRVGDPLTITIKVSSFNGAPTGSITLYDSGGSATYSLIATLPLDSTGTATYTTSTLQQGFHDFVAYFAGDSFYAPSTSLIDNVVVNNLPTVTMTLKGAPNPGTVGQNVALTATIVVRAPAPTGSVAFLDSGTLIGIVPLTAAGTAVLNTSSLIIGAHTIKASYSGDSNYVSQQATVSEVIRYPPTVLTLSSSLNPESFGQSVIFTAKATATGPTPAGSVIFQDNGKQAGQVTLAADGTAAFATSSLSAGSHVIQAIYSGDSNYDSQSATLTEVVAPAPTLATLSVSPNPATAGQVVTLKALVTGAGTPAGNVTFFDGATSIGSASLDGTGTAVLNTTNLQVGTHPLTATFGGTSNWTASSSTVVNEVIIPNPRDYTLGLNGSLTLHTEHHGSTVVTATPVGGLSDTISISCGSLPSYVTCEVVPSQVTISNGTPQNVTVKIDTDAVLGYASVDRYLRVVVAVLLPCLFFGLPFDRRKFRLGVISLCLLTFLASGIIGCSGKYPSSTPPGTYSILINGHGQSTGLDRTTTLTLIVTPKQTQ
jgi:Bacterial Ig-like domain (group 3)/FG-GAP-like repeat